MLSNSYGQAINDFYYSYTLYAVEAIKPSVKSRIDEISKLKVYSDKIKKAYSDKMKKAYSDKMKKAYSDKMKEEFDQNIVSDNSLDDHHKIIRLLCFAGLTIFLPITVYSSFFLVIYGFINCSLEKLNLSNLKTVENRREFVSAIAAGIVNILISLSIFYSVYPLAFNNQRISIKTMVEHSNYKIRIEGLRELCKSRDTIWSYPDFIKHALNGNIAEKYWLANAFSAAKNPDALTFLEKFIYDPSINVQCAAIDAMAKIGITNKENRDFNFKIKDILKSKIADSDHWYVQQRAYNCLKNIIYFNHDYK
ncbi:MAG: HEAT repeat domain-containing protein [Desulfamplus sp.]